MRTAPCVPKWCVKSSTDIQNHQDLKFLLSLGGGSLEELISYDTLSDLISEQQDTEEQGLQDVLPMNGILYYEDPLKPHDPKYKGSSYNLFID